MSGQWTQIEPERALKLASKGHLVEVNSLGLYWVCL